MTRELERVSAPHREILDRFTRERPVRLAALAKALGVNVISSTLPVGISGEIRPTEDGRAYDIRVNRHDAPVRQRFTVAHEIAHYLLHRDVIGTGVADDALYRSRLSNSREAEANRLAAQILIPNEQLQIAFDRARALQLQGSDLYVHLAKEFNVSEAAMKIRLGVV